MVQGTAMNNDPQLSSAGRVRIWLQQGTANPGVNYGYMGRCQLEKSDQDLGKATPVYNPSSTTRDQWDIVDLVKNAPGLPTTGFTQHASRYLTDEWVSIRNRGCLVNVKAIWSNCARPDDPTNWDAQLLFGRAKLVKFGFPVLNVLDGAKNQEVDINGDLEAQLMAVLYPMTFQNVAETTVVAEMVDAFYYDAIQCGECGAPSDGCQKVFGLQVANTGSPGLSSQVMYSQDGGNTWAAMDIPTLGGVSAGRFAPMGVYCIVVGPNTGSYHYAKFTDILAGTINWSAQTSGFVAGKSPKCITARDPANCFIGAQGGYIYFLNNPGSAVTVLTDGSISTQDVNDIHYFGRTAVAVGNSNLVLYSLNNGVAWALITGPLVGQNLSAVWCLSATAWFVGTGNGQLWYTLNAGASWTRQLFDAGNFTTINDIQFYDENVGYMAVEIGGVARVYRTVDGGATWQYNTSAISPLPSPTVRVNVVAPCSYNTCIAAGRKSVGGDGSFAIARNAG